MQYQHHNPVADPAAVIRAGHARFTILTPTLVRLEWSPNGRFEDRASLAFVNRRLPQPGFKPRLREGWWTIETDRLMIRYRDDGERFSAQNLSISFDLNGSTRTWRPGMRDTGNLGGTIRTLDNVNGATPVEPGILSRDGWTVVDDSHRHVLDGRPAWPKPRSNSGAIDWYFFGHGHDYAGALRDFTGVAGRIPLPPRFVFGSWWSRYWAYSDHELQTLVRDFHKHEVPLDVLVIDMDWHLDGWTGYTWNPKYFPDPKKFLDWVHARGLKTTLNLHPADGVGKHEARFGEMARAMGKDAHKTDHIPFDCTDTKFVDAYFKILHHPLERQGIDFWWMDWQQGTHTRIPGLDPLPWLNHLHWTDMERRAAMTRKRPLIFSRWGGLGNHRYQIGFSGDVYSTWESLAFQPYFTATAGNVGYAFWSHDIGGHQPGPVDPEMYVRWIQWGALSPVLRTHCTSRPEAERRIWAFPKEAFESARQAFYLRYDLLPYIYTAARKCADESLPLCRPLYYSWPEFDEAYAHASEYQFGDDLIVAPAVSPSHKLSGLARTPVWIPPGTWIDWFTGDLHTGPREITRLSPLDEIPMFVRGGAVIPATENLRRGHEHASGPLILHVFGSGDGESRVYEDDGESDEYRRGRAAFIPVRHRIEGSVESVTIGPVEGSYRGMPKQRVYEIRFRNRWPKGRVFVNGRPARWTFDPLTFSVIVRTPPQANRQTSVVEFRTNGSLTQSDGVLGQMRRFARIQGVLHHHTPAAVLQALRVWRTAGPRAFDDKLLSIIRRARSRLILDILRAGVPVDRRARAIAVALDFFASFDMQRAGKNTFELVASAEVNRRTDELPEIRGSIRVGRCCHWKITGQSDWAVRLTPPKIPQTDILDAVVSLRIGHQTFPVRLEALVVPSINSWWLMGPFDAVRGKGLDHILPPEKRVRLKETCRGKNGRTVGWKRWIRPLAHSMNHGEEFYVDFHGAFGAHHTDAVAYAYTVVHSPVARKARLAIGSDDGVVVWLNGREIHRNVVQRAYTSKQDIVPITLRRGPNSLLIKVDQYVGGWGFCAHVETPDGKPMPDLEIS